jgi:hypothetical protein
MSPPPLTAVAPERLAPPWVWLHRSLMPDYNRKATAYWWTVVLLGTAAVAHSAASVAMLPLAR